jgi:hypothetical protein
MFITAPYYTAKNRRREEKTIDKRTETCFNALKAVTKTVGTFRATEIRVS